MLLDGIIFTEINNFMLAGFDQNYRTNLIGIVRPRQKSSDNQFRAFNLREIRRDSIGLFCKSIKFYIVKIRPISSIFRQHVQVKTWCI